MRSKDTGLRAVMVTQLVLLLPIMIAMLALVVDCANMSRCKALASSAASEGARYAAANPDLTDSEVEAYVRGGNRPRRQLYCRDRAQFARSKGRDAQGG